MGMTDEQLARWEKTRKMGRTKFVWLVGVLGWGVGTGSLWAVATAALRNWEDLPRLLALALVGFPIGGYFFGTLVWKSSESRYQKALAEKQEKEREW